MLELGSELISSDIIAFYELIKNGFDAKTKNGIEIRFDIPLATNAYRKLVTQLEKLTSLSAAKEQIISALDATASEAARSGFAEVIEDAGSFEQLREALKEAQARFNTITISDTGSGMSMEDLEKSFLVIGTPSRKRDVEAALRNKNAQTPYLGEKGIGRLSAMRLGDRLRVETARESDTNINLLEIDWKEFADVDAMLDQIHISPEVGPPKRTKASSGTTMIISDLGENWTEVAVGDMAGYEFARLSDPFLNAATRPRIAIFWHGERKSIPIMPSSLLDAAHARIVGKYEIVDNKPLLTCHVEVNDLGFEHPREHETVVRTEPDLLALLIGRNFDVEDDALLTVGPFSFDINWYNRRRLTAIEAIGDLKAVKAAQEKWGGIMLFRDRFRVFPYGEDEDDWLDLDRLALRRSGYLMNKTQFTGRVRISRTGNPQLVDQTNREGLRSTSEEKVFLRILRYVVQDILGDSIKSVERQYKNQKIDFSEAESKVNALENRAKSAVSRLKKIAPKEEMAAIEDLQQALLEFSEFAEDARKRIAEVEQESRQMLEMAGVGLMVEVVAHELARASENALEALERLKDKDLPQGVRAHLAILQAEMKSVSKRVRILDPMSVSGRQRKEAFSLDELVKNSIEAHEAQFQRHSIAVKLISSKAPVYVKAVKGMIVQILENLISNSVYWMDMRAKRESSYKPEIRITIESSPPVITFEDNGPGIAPDNKDKIFKAFFSLKDTDRRRGLGLFIARESAEYCDGTLTLDATSKEKNGRLHRFVFELPQASQQ